ncbi:hypothetical protein LSCM4_05648 [Leishmania orientalis]|uniref:Transmembrane protein n=1 Tax=Leishmania orientalis TaxID=2249476 RepID=A0A836KTP2_9TRYP|nr:hypothetical protein LSCM4_05648 [Leishmania orientalis]
MCVCSVRSQWSLFCQYQKDGLVQTFSVWDIRTLSSKGESLKSEDGTTVLRVMLFLSAVLSTAAFAFSISFAFMRAHHDELREEEESGASAAAQQLGLNGNAPLRDAEEASTKRDETEQLLGVAALRFLVSATLCSLATEWLMSSLHEILVAEAAAGSHGGGVMSCVGFTRTKVMSIAGAVGSALLIISHAAERRGWGLRSSCPLQQHTS